MTKTNELRSGAFYQLDSVTQGEFVGFVDVLVHCESGIGDYDELQEKPAFRVAGERMLRVWKDEDSLPVLVGA